MAIFTIGDLHLSLGTDKPMDIFGGWKDYVQRLTDAWEKNVSNDDLIVLAGDISWAMSLDACYKDFSFIHELPGKKLLLKGNHDYWWTTLAKMNAYLQENGFYSLSFLHNNYYKYDEIAICGTRGWLLEENCAHDEKIASREASRLENSLKAAQDLQKIVFLHYPPIYKEQQASGIVEILQKYNIKRCFYGHLHGCGINGALNGVKDGIEYRLISADALQFQPHKIYI